MIAASVVCSAMIIASVDARSATPDAPTLLCWPTDERASYLAYEQRLIASPTRQRLLDMHIALASEPHVAGTPGDWKVIETIEKAFREYGEGIEGWSVEVEEFWAYLSRPIASTVQVITPLETITLDLKEKPVWGDPAAAAAAEPFPYLAYAASGDVDGEVVYANYGTKADFDRLRAWGVDLTGKVVVCRYGGNYRGFKVKFAQEAGAAAVIMFTDPSDSGFVRGEVYPAGGWSNECCTQRGSLLVTGWQGDPLTPGVFASKDAPRLDPSDVSLPRIPAQPMGYGPAGEILRRMAGDNLPPEAESWKGGISTTYRLTGGPNLRVRVKVEQKRELVRTANVIATLRGGSTEPAEARQRVIVGCHHDAWNAGAADPTCGTIAVMEAARAFADQARHGHRPRRTVAFAAWGAEEHGIIGSCEHVERHRDLLNSAGVAYINLDMASMGTQFGASASPELKTVIADVARVVPQARNNAISVFDDWSSRAKAGGSISIGDVGGGSDHVGFLMHAGVPSASFGSGGSKGNSYHSAYDTLPWYWKVVGDDYESAMMISRMAIAVAARLADAPLLPLDTPRASKEFAGHLRALAPAAREVAAIRPLADPADPTQIDALIEQAELAARRASPTLGHFPGQQALLLNRVDRQRLLNIANEKAMASSRRWLPGPGIPGRPWFRNWYVSTDENSGYANWILPGIRRAIETRDPAALSEALAVYRGILAR
jgi:N-acetylated-alpha-linked acidic dipeptidase